MFTLIFITQYGMEIDKYSLTYLLALLQKAKQNNDTRSWEESYDAWEDYYAKNLREIVAAKEPKNEKYVTLWNSHSITIKPEANPSKPLIISAFRLRHTATALHVVYSNGEQFVGMANYLEKNSSKHHNAIKSFCKHSLKYHNKGKKITKVNFFIMETSNKPKEDNPYYPYSEWPLEHFPKQLLDPIQPINTQSLYYNPLYVQESDPKTCEEITVFYPPIFEIILYPHKAFLLTDSKKIRICDTMTDINPHTVFAGWILQNYCASK